MPRGEALHGPALARARKTLLQRIRKGNTFRDSCLAAGIPWSTWREWRAQVEDGSGTTGDPDKDSLVRDARRAYQRATSDILAGIRAQAPLDWKAAAWLVDYREGSAKRRAEQRRAHHEARLAKAKADDAVKGERAPVVVIELPASLARPREEPK